MFRTLSLAALVLCSFTACNQTADEKIKQQMTEKVHALTAEERLLAQTNAKQFFEKEWPVRLDDGTIGKERGFWMECRPSDSNYNGLVTCQGKLPQINGGFQDVKRYCGYRPEMSGCSDEDTFK